MLFLLFLVKTFNRIKDILCGLGDKILISEIKQPGW